MLCWGLTDESAGRCRGGRPHVYHIPEINVIGSMLTYLGRRWMYIPNEVWSLGSWGHVYKCKYVGDDGDCEIYDLRPKMCRTYPEEMPHGECDSLGCTWDAVRAEVPSILQWDV